MRLTATGRLFRSRVYGIVHGACNYADVFRFLAYDRKVPPKPSYICSMTRDRLHTDVANVP